MKLIPKLFFAAVLVAFSGALSSLVLAQTAESFFHGGAQTYIGGDLPLAINQVLEGLNRFPDDLKLNELLQKLQEEQEKQQQQNQQNQEQQEQEQNQEQQQQQEENQEQEQNEQQENEEQQNQEPQDQEQQPAQPQNLDEMSKEEAEKILQALAQKEKELLKEFKKQKPQGSATHDKDW
jgi:DNA anti-recombination protein RmuC